MLQLLFAMTLASSTPAIDPGVYCLSARSAVPPQDQSGVYLSCIRDQQAAREQLHQKWTEFPAETRGACAPPKAVSRDYVELLACLENTQRK